MKDIHDVLRQKEEELARISQEVEALRLVVRLLSADGNEKQRPSIPTQPVRDAAVAGRIKDFP
ncbi:MAG: hypothetical protein JO065_06720 [Acidobacteria bacterium]|nr:hypothetical protein [Acidobacteriota bacterium]MBV9435879.1 hypothetical protein [Acidobacteriota bacterium]